MKKIFDLESISIKPPSVHVWMRRHYCPEMAAMLRSPVMVRYLKRYNAAMETVYDWSHLDETLGGLYIQMCFYQKQTEAADLREAYGEVVDEGLLLGFYFYGPDVREPPFNTSPQYHMDCPLDGRLHLLPYMFRIDDNDIIYVPEHWQKLEQLGLIEPGLLERSIFTTVEP